MGNVTKPRDRPPRGWDRVGIRERVVWETTTVLPGGSSWAAWTGTRRTGQYNAAIEPIEDIDREIERLLDGLLDLIEPTPLSVEISISSRGTQESAVIQIEVRPDTNRKPYAFLSQGGRHFVRRIGARNVPLSRLELEQMFAAGRETSQPPPNWETAAKALLKDRASFITQEPSSLWLRILPTADVQFVETGRDKLVDLLRNPVLTKNRSMGWNFTSQFYQPEISQDAISTRRGVMTDLWVRYRDGEVRFRVDLTELSWASRIGGGWPNGTDPDRTFYSCSLIEYPTSVFRLAAEIFRDECIFLPAVEDETPFLVDFFITGLDGWRLRPHDPENPTYALTDPRQYTAGSVLAL